MGPIQTLDDLLGFLRRRWPVVLLVALIGTAATLAYALSMPRTYESSAVIQFEVSQVSDGEGREGALNAAQRVQLIEQRLTARENLVAMIDRHGLFADAPQLTLGQKVALLRSSLTLLPVSAAAAGFGREGQLSALIVTVRLDDPVKAAEVANDFATSVLQENLRREVARSRATLEFFTREEARLGEALAALEAEIAAFKNAHEMALPGNLGFLRDELARIEAGRRDLQQRILELSRERDALGATRPVRAVEQRQIDELTGQIEVLTAQERRLADRSAALEAALREAPEVERGLAAFDRRRTQLQEQYAVATRRLAEAETAERLLASQQAARLELLERAVVPDFALGSGRRRVAAMGVAASLGLGLALALLLEMMNPVIRTAGQMERALNLRPVVVIPYIESPAELRRRKAARVVAVALLALGFLLAMGLAGAWALLA